MEIALVNCKWRNKFLTNLHKSSKIILEIQNEVGSTRFLKPSQSCKEEIASNYYHIKMMYKYYANVEVKISKWSILEN